MQAVYLVNSIYLDFNIVEEIQVMRVFTIFALGSLVLAAAVASPVDDTDSSIRINDVQSWVDNIMPLLRRFLGASDRQSNMGVIAMAIQRIRNLIEKYAPIGVSHRSSRVLKDNSTYTTKDLLADFGTTLKDFEEHLNETSSQGRQAKSLFKNINYKWLLYHTRFANKVQARMSSLMNGPEAESLAVSGGIATGIMGVTGLGLLLSNANFLRRSDAEGRSFSNFRSWEITNEIEDTFPVVSSLKSAWNKFDDLNKGRSFVEKFDEIWYEIKNFFLQYGIVRRVDSLYRSEAVNPASVYGGVGAGLLGALGLGLLFGGAREGKKARTTGRSLNLDDDNSKEAEVPQYVLDSIDGIWSSFVSELNSTAEKEIENEARTTEFTADVGEEEDRTFKRPSLPTALTNFLQKHGLNTKITDRIGTIFKAKTPLALAGGATAAAVGITGVSLLGAAIARKDQFGFRGGNQIYADEYDPSYYQSYYSNLAPQSVKSQQPQYFVQQIGSQPQQVAVRPQRNFLAPQYSSSQNNAQFPSQQQLQVTNYQQQAPQNVLVKRQPPQQEQSFTRQPALPEQSFTRQPAVPENSFTESSGFFASQPVYQPFNEAAQQPLQPVQQVLATTTQAPITETQVAFLRSVIMKISEGTCSQAMICMSLSGDQPQLIQLAYLARSYDDQLGAYKTPLKSLMKAARRRDCTAYKC
ncbi:uncharacterized protein LOC136029655 [Artemia franciscana]